jgi:hypothetical protein
VPRKEHTKPPGPLPAIEDIKRSTFRFRKDQRRKLIELLPPKLADLSVPFIESVPSNVKTIADMAVQATEEAINSHLTAIRLVLEGGLTPAKVRAAIRRLREALRPFVRGWVDSETAEIIPEDLDDKLAARDQEIATLRLSWPQRRALAMLCQIIVMAVKNCISISGETVSEDDILRYVDAALSFAKIKHSDPKKHRARFAALVFPKD